MTANVANSGFTLPHVVVQHALEKLRHSSL